LKPILLKNSIHQKCIEIVNEKIDNINTTLQELQEAANNETKSSAGDKYETSRAMAQLETEKLGNQLTETLKLITVLDRINPDLKTSQVALGSIVTTNNGDFYISVSLGKLTINHQSIFAISTLSPIGELLLTKKVKETFTFNDKNYKILAIC